jgi:glycine/D-amino acid oxidase-like deaminating enzyme/nitrite reductase/ring-hydroxylating ferredoxin subunit
MNLLAETTKSLWMGTAPWPRHPTLKTDVSCDVIVVGAGIAGISCAYELAERGQQVVVIDRGKVGCGVTSRTTGHLTPFCDDTTRAMIKIRGEDIARFFYESQAAAVDRIEQIVAQHNISCNFRRLDGYLFAALGTEWKDEREDLAAEYIASRKIGIPVEKTTGLTFAGMDKVPALRFPAQATFHPLKYLNALVEQIAAHKGRVFEDTAAVSFEESDESVTVTTTSGHKLRAKYCIVATNSPVNDWVAIHSKQAPYRTYAMAFTVPSGSLRDALYWDTADPYHYVRLNPGPGTVDYLIVGGADHKSGEVDDGKIRFEAIEAWMRQLLPQLGKEVNRWSGQVLDTIDYAGYIGRNSGDKRTFIVTGDSGQGMTHGALSGILLADLILEGSSPWTEVYDPTRIVVSAAKNFIAENVTALKSFAEYIAPGEVSSFDELKPGDGAIVRDGLSKVAAYRDARGVLHKRSALCSHLGCHIHWNSTETCWDCPCHGSQFGIDGEVLHGPAIADLAKIK